MITKIGDKYCITIPCDTSDTDRYHMLKEWSYAEDIYCEIISPNKAYFYTNTIDSAIEILLRFT